LLGWRVVCLINDDGSEHIYLSGRFLIMIVEEIIGKKLLKRDEFPNINAIKVINKNKDKLKDWSIKFITDRPALIEHPELNLQYLISPVIFT